MNRQNFRDPLQINLTLTAAFTLDTMLFIDVSEATGLRDEIILVTGVTGQIIVRDPAAGVAYDMSDKVILSMDGIVSSPKAGSANTNIFFKVNRYFYPFNLQLLGVTAATSYTFMFNGGDWPATPPAGNLQLLANINIYFETVAGL